MLVENKIPEPGLWMDEDYICHIATRNGFELLPDDDDRCAWALSVFKSNDFLRFYDAAEMVMMRKIQPDELKRVGFVLTSPNLSPEERLEGVKLLSGW